MAKHQRRADVFPNRSGGLDMSGSTAPNDGWKIKVMYIELSRKKKMVHWRIKLKNRILSNMKAHCLNLKFVNQVLAPTIEILAMISGP